MKVVRSELRRLVIKAVGLQYHVRASKLGLFTNAALSRKDSVVIVSKITILVEF